MGPELEYALEGSPNADCLLNIDDATPRGSNQALDFHIRDAANEHTKADEA